MHYRPRCGQTAWAFILFHMLASRISATGTICLMFSSKNNIDQYRMRRFLQSSWGLGPRDAYSNAYSQTLRYHSFAPHALLKYLSHASHAMLELLSHASQAADNSFLDCTCDSATCFTWFERGDRNMFQGVVSRELRWKNLPAGETLQPQTRVSCCRTKTERKF